jgi:7-cyano-7-deazaguanine reductase
MTDYTSANQLGKNSSIPNSPDKAILDVVPNPHPDVSYCVRFTCPEFTSICPVTGQPDFAHIVIDYVPEGAIVESKSLKLFMNSFRNHPDFHEACTIYIAKRFIAACKPKWLRIGGYWYPRGGIPIDIFYQTSTPPEGVMIPEQGVPPYKGRG